MTEEVTPFDQMVLSGLIGVGQWRAAQIMINLDSMLEVHEEDVTNDMRHELARFHLAITACILDCGIEAFRNLCKIPPLLDGACMPEEELLNLTGLIFHPLNSLSRSYGFATGLAPSDELALSAGSPSPGSESPDEG